jgi:hypothetical protein
MKFLSFWLLIYFIVKMCDMIAMVKMCDVVSVSWNMFVLMLMHVSFALQTFGLKSFAVMLNDNLYLSVP